MIKNQKKLLKIETIFFPSRYGQFDLTLYSTHYKNQPSMKYVLVLKTKTIPQIPLIRIHSACIFSEVFGYLGCDCRDQLIKSINLIAKKGGILFYLDQEGRGYGLNNKIREIKIQQTTGLDTVEASEKLNLPKDARRYDVIVDILKEMKINQVKIITNNPQKMKFITNNKIQIIKRIRLKTFINQYNYSYLKTKKEKLGHQIIL